MRCTLESRTLVSSATRRCVCSAAENSLCDSFSVAEVRARISWIFRCWSADSWRCLAICISRLPCAPSTSRSFMLRIPASLFSAAMRPWSAATVGASSSICRREASVSWRKW